MPVALENESPLTAIIEELKGSSANSSPAASSEQELDDTDFSFLFEDDELSELEEPVKPVVTPEVVTKRAPAVNNGVVDGMVKVRPNPGIVRPPARAGRQNLSQGRPMQARQPRSIDGFSVMSRA